MELSWGVDVFFHRYSLKSTGFLNAKSSRTEHEGLLIKVGNGYGCIHPWQVLGDPSLEELIEQLRVNRRTPLIAKALECAEIDGKAREAGVSLFEKIEVPDSHSTIVGGMKSVANAVEAGFKTLKIKAGRAPEDEVVFINEINASFPELSLRIDFNCHLSGSQVGDFVESLSDSARQQIQYLEDPCGYKDSCWSGLRNLYGIRLAMDIGVEQVDALYSYAVIKPAKNNVNRVLEKSRAQARKCVFTSYLDHPLGQAFAAYSAGLAHKDYPELMETCGLMTHELFEKTEFSERLGAVRPSWSYKEGTGLGFDDLLENIPWEKLC